MILLFCFAGKKKMEYYLSALVCNFFVAKKKHGILFICPVYVNLWFKTH